MISLGANFGGPEYSESAFKAGWMRISQAIRDPRGGGLEEWEGKVPGVNVVFYVPGSVMDHASVTRTEAARFSRAKKLLLVNVPVPREITQDWDRSLRFILDALHEANAIAAEVFARKSVGQFDLTKADTIVDQAGASVSAGPHVCFAVSAGTARAQSLGQTVAAIMSQPLTDEEKMEAVRRRKAEGMDRGK